jgi:hypothetical protein
MLRRDFCRSMRSDTSRAMPLSSCDRYSGSAREAAQGQYRYRIRPGTVFRPSLPDFIAASVLPVRNVRDQFMVEAKP